MVKLKEQINKLGVPEDLSGDLVASIKINISSEFIEDEFLFNEMINGYSNGVAAVWKQIQSDFNEPETAKKIMRKMMEEIRFELKMPD